MIGILLLISPSLTVDDELIPNISFISVLSQLLEVNNFLFSTRFLLISYPSPIQSKVDSSKKVLLILTGSEDPISI